MILSVKILYAIFPYHLVQCHSVHTPFCPYHFVRTIVSSAIFVLEPLNDERVLKVTETDAVCH